MDIINSVGGNGGAFSQSMRLPHSSSSLAVELSICAMVELLLNLESFGKMVVGLQKRENEKRK
ncbi:uncharacterized protein G2W53_041615 [Senna tora]|uniref:Uncharacterized protein n=1 Tax=Senna tora TaxID=362788 RepID=A0A834W325_9FABA|nr:uncharacterized protein G2W53_041615 [Senna tora]